jgi:hypothetical protein
MRRLRFVGKSSFRKSCWLVTVSSLLFAVGLSLTSCNSGADPFRSMEVDSAYVTSRYAALPTKMPVMPDSCKRWKNVVPYFMLSGAAMSEEEIEQDLRIISNCSGLDWQSAELLRDQAIFGSILVEMAGESNIGRPGYGSTIEYVQRKFISPEFADFLMHIRWSNEMINRPISLDSWEQDRQFFIVAGVNREDLDLYYAFISDPSREEMSYLQAFRSCGIDFENDASAREEIYLNPNPRVFQ